MKGITAYLTAARRIALLHDEMLTRACLKHRLTLMEANVVSFLSNNPDRDTASDIVELRMFSKAAVSKAVDGLLKAGYVVRHADDADRRIIHLSLTPSASGVQEDIAQCNQDYFDCLFSGFTNEELGMFTHLYLKMADNAKEKRTNR